MSHRQITTAVGSVAAFLFVSIVLVPSSVSANDTWLTAPSYYSHDPSTGERLTQYAPIGPFASNPQPGYQRSAYRHTRFSLRDRGSFDNLHVVEEFGRPIRPYGEWQYPYRPYSTPYSYWGPPYAGLGPTYNFYPGYPGFPGGGIPPGGPGFGPGPGGPGFGPGGPGFGPGGPGFGPGGPGGPGFGP